MFPESPSLKVVANAPVQPLKGRWGYVDNAEEYLLGIDITELRAVTGKHFGSSWISFLLFF